MAICYFNNDDRKKYRCTYSFEEDSLCASVEYDIYEEIPALNGVRCIGGCNYDQRDILIVDSEVHKSFLMKEAYYAGNRITYGSVDNKSITTFKTSEFFACDDSDKIFELPSNPKCNAIRIFSNDFIRWIGVYSYKKEISDEELIIRLKRKPEPIDFGIETSKIKRIMYNDDWECNTHSDAGVISIRNSPYEEIQFKRAQNHEELFKYIFEFNLYMHLYSRGGFKVDRILTRINTCFYEFHCATRKFDYTGNKNRCVDDNLSSFLRGCYLKIDYSVTKKSWLRNISYAVGPKARNIEDNFLLFYRFV
jgi:hypothetical protein